MQFHDNKAYDPDIFRSACAGRICYVVSYNFSRMESTVNESLDSYLPPHSDGPITRASDLSDGVILSRVVVGVIYDARLSISLGSQRKSSNALMNHVLIGPVAAFSHGHLEGQQRHIDA